jgi:hypothetical protein
LASIFLRSFYLNKTASSTLKYLLGVIKIQAMHGSNKVA